MVITIKGSSLVQNVRRKILFGKMYLTITVDVKRVPF